MAQPGSRDDGRRKGRLWKKIEAFNRFIDTAGPFLPELDRYLWLVLFRHATDGTVKRSHGRLAKDLGCSERTIRRAMDRLEETGLVRVVERGGLRVGASTFRLGVRDLRSSQGGTKESDGATAEPMTTGHQCPVIADTAVTDITYTSAARGPDGSPVPLGRI
jgi:DNA-binding transcriptional ArsR family regulator